MNLCSDDHDEICYVGRKCPCCELKLEIKRLEEIEQKWDSHEC